MNQQYERDPSFDPEFIASLYRTELLAAVDDAVEYAALLDVQIPQMYEELGISDGESKAASETDQLQRKYLVDDYRFGMRCQKVEVAVFREDGSTQSYRLYRPLDHGTVAWIELRNNSLNDSQNGAFIELTTESDFFITELFPSFRNGHTEIVPHSSGELTTGALLYEMKNDLDLIEKNPEQIDFNKQIDQYELLSSN